MIPLPSQIVLIVPPLVATLGKAEIEHAAAVIVRACHANGDRWQPVTWEQVAAALRSDGAANTQPFAALIRNPFFRPDVHALIRAGFARVTVEEPMTVELTEEAISRIAAKWMDQPRTEQ